MSNKKTWGSRLFVTFKGELIQLVLTAKYFLIHFSISLWYIKSIKNLSGCVVSTNKEVAQLLYQNICHLCHSTEKRTHAKNSCYGYHYCYLSKAALEV